MFNVIVALVVIAIVLYFVKVVIGVNKNVDETTGDSGVFGTDLYRNSKASVDSEFKVEEPKAVKIDPAIVDSVEEAPKKKKAVAKKKPAAKKKTASKKKG